MWESIPNGPDLTSIFVLWESDFTGPENTFLNAAEDECAGDRTADPGTRILTNRKYPRQHIATCGAAIRWGVAALSVTSSLREGIPELPKVEEEEGEEEEEEERRGRSQRIVVFALEGRGEGAVASSGAQGLSRRKNAAGAGSESQGAGTAASSTSAGKESRASRGSKPRFAPVDPPFWQQTWFLIVLFLMALSFFALAFVLFLGLEIEEGSPNLSFAAPPAADGVEVREASPFFQFSDSMGSLASRSSASRPLILSIWSSQITYGTTLKLMHERTKFRLHSHNVPYGSGSGQQSVTGFPNVDDSNSYWVRLNIYHGIPTSNVPHFLCNSTRCFSHRFVVSRPLSVRINQATSTRHF